MAKSFDWNQFEDAAPVTQDAGSFDWDKFDDAEHPEKQKPSALVSGVRKVIQGSTGKFSDELMGVGEAIGRAAGLDNTSHDISEISVNPSGPTLNPNLLLEAYRKGRDHERASLAEDSKAHPYVSGVSEFAGGILSPVNKVAGGMSMAKGGAALGGIYSAGASEADLTKPSVENYGRFAKDVGIGAGSGALFGYGLDKASPYAMPVIEKGVGVVRRGAEKIGQGTKKLAEKIAVNATGATGKQASEFSEDAGRQLLDRGIVRFGDTQEKISERAGDAVKQAYNQIDDALKGVEAKGGKVDLNTVYGTIKQKINELRKDPSKADIVRHLDGELENLVQASKEMGAEHVGLNAAEQIKRGFNRKAGNWADPEKGEAGKVVYRAWKNAVEDTATGVDDAMGALFKEGKDTYGLLAPIEEAAARRAATTQQSPAGGLLDIGTGIGTLATTGNPIAAVAAPIARRVIAPRAASSMAVTADKVANGLLKIPKYLTLSKSDPQTFRALVTQVEQRLGPQSPVVSPPKAAEQNFDSPNAPSPVDSQEPKEAAKPLKGQEKWADDGFNKLLDHTKDPEVKAQLEKNKGALLKSKKAKDLLAQASDLKVGSKALDRMLTAVRLHAQSSGDAA